MTDLWKLVFDQVDAAAKIVIGHRVEALDDGVKGTVLMVRFGNGDGSELRVEWENGLRTWVNVRDIRWL